MKRGKSTSRVEPDYRKFIWVELYAFNPTDPDFGAARYLDNVGFKVDGIFFDIRYIDFVNTHERNIDDTPLDYKYCANYCRPGGHVWTRRQLKGLVEALQAKGVRAYFSQMTTLCTNLRADFKPLDTKLAFIRDKHPELIGRGAFGELEGCITPIKRFKDGRYYEDFFAEKLAEVLEDYGFEGFFPADAMIHLYGPVLQSDFSDDMVAQFIERTSISLPPNLKGKLDEKGKLFQERLEWIRTHYALEWIRFYAERWAEFVKKMVDVCHARGAKVIANDAIQNDPFQALYRFGCDYRLVAEAGLDGMVLQTNSGSAELLLGFSTRKVNHDWVEKMVATILTTKAQVPELPLYFLCCIQDEGEKWDTLRYAPALLEKEILSYTATYLLGADESIRHCLDGVLFCLGDGISHQEWTWLKNRIDLGFSGVPESAGGLPGPTAVWMPEAVDNQLEARCAYPNDAQPSPHRLLWDLLSASVPIRSITTQDAIENLQRPAILFNPAYVGAEGLSEWERWKTHSGQIAMEVGRLTERPSQNVPFAELRYLPDDGPEVTWGRIFAPEPHIGYAKRFSEICAGGGPADCSVSIELDAQRRKLPSPAITVTVPWKELLHRKSDEYPTHWASSIPFDDLPSGLFKQCATLLKCFDELDVRTSSGRPFAIRMAGSRLRLFITNEEAFYEWTDVSLRPEIEHVITLTRFPKVPILNTAHSFLIQIPPLGMALLEMEVKTS